MSDELPEGWALRSLPAIFDINPRKPAAGVLPAVAPVTFVPMSAVDANRGQIVGASTRPFGQVRKGYTAFANRDVILAKITPCFENGKAAVASQLANGLGFGSSEFHVFRSNGAVEPEYLFHFVRQETFRRDAADHMTGTAGQARVPADYLREIELPVAPLPEQRRIVEKVEALLEHVNRAKARLERVPLILKRFRQAVLVAACSGELTKEWRERNPDIVGPPLPEPIQDLRRGRRGANLSGDGALLVDDELPELPDTWSYVRVDRLTAPGTVITYGIVLPGPEVEGGVPYVRGQDVEDGRLRTDALRHTTKQIVSKHERSSLRTGDILLCIIRNLRVAVVPDGLDGANITQGMVRIRTSPNVLVRDFLASYLMSPLAQGWMKRRYFGMDMPRINVEDARAIPVALPPLDEQVEIVRDVAMLFAVADAIERHVRAASEQAQRLPQAILSKAFSGELVATEAEVARAETRSYETASELLARVVGNIQANGVAKKSPRAVKKRRAKSR